MTQSNTSRIAHQLEIPETQARTLVDAVQKEFRASRFGGVPNEADIANFIDWHWEELRAMMRTSRRAVVVRIAADDGWKGRRGNRAKGRQSKAAHARPTVATTDAASEPNTKQPAAAKTNVTATKKAVNSQTPKTHKSDPPRTQARKEQKAIKVQRRRKGRSSGPRDETAARKSLPVPACDASLSEPPYKPREPYIPPEKPLSIRNLKKLYGDWETD